MNPVFYSVFKAIRGRGGGLGRRDGGDREKDVERALRGLGVVGLILVALLIAYVIFGR